MIPTNGPLNTMWDGLFGLMGADNVEVGGMVAMESGRNMDKEHGVGPWDGINPLCQAVNFCSIGLLPHGAIRTFPEFGIFSKFTGVGVEGIAMEGGVKWASIWGCILGSMQSMEAGGMTGLLFGMGLWWTGDGWGWLQGRWSVIISWYGVVIMESFGLVHPQRCGRGDQHRKGGRLVAMVVGWVASTLRDDLVMVDWGTQCHGE